MDKNEREIQNALGHMKEYRVKITLPVKTTVDIYKNVMAPTKDDAIENVKTIFEMSPPREIGEDIRKALQDQYRCEFEVDSLTCKASLGGSVVVPSPMPAEDFRETNITWVEDSNVKMSASCADDSKCESNCDSSSPSNCP